jgi:hypothetical protein
VRRALMLAQQAHGWCLGYTRDHVVVSA